MYSTKFPPRRNTSWTPWEEGRLQNIYRKADISTLNALYLPLWPHLCQVDLWTIFLGRLSFRKVEEESLWDNYSSGGLDGEQV